MKKKIIALLMVATLAMAGCGTNVASGSTTTQEDAKEPLDLTGTWESENNDGSWMEATISNDVITINWVSDNGDTKSIYWVGSYDAPTESTDEYTWTSTRDKEQTDTALMASTDDTKEFTYSKDELSYSASALGTTTTVRMKKDK